GKEKELTVRDSYDRAVTVHKPIKRIVAASPRCSLTMLRSIRVEENRIVGVESLIQSSGGGKYGVNHKIFFPEYQDKPTVGLVWNPDCEAILELNPDVVFLIASPGLSGATAVDKASDVLESAGITVLRIYAGVYVKGVPEEVKRLGYIFDKRKEAEEFVNSYNKYMNWVKERVEKIPEEDKPKVYFESSFGTYQTGGEHMTHIEFGGGKTIFPEIVKHGSVDPEAVAMRNPDIIVKVASAGVSGYDMDPDDTTKIEKVREEIMSRAELQNVKAVKTGRVYVISSYIVGYGPADEGAGFLHKLYMAKWLHPDLFGDLDPKAIHQEFLTRFQGLDIDLDEHGVFAYPPLEES
ncbi:MAG: ABC transporter substrate-binding protein, partial [Methanophagales archaeon]|nr:ABC transporter substrate-binding protein [Methanophagales archaeon]